MNTTNKKVLNQYFFYILILYICIMNKKELKFYGTILSLIDSEIKHLKINPNNFKENDYFISRQTYFTIKRVCEKNDTSKRLRVDTLKNICLHFGFELYDTDYLMKKI